jgi:hypothetical protein
MDLKQERLDNLQKQIDSLECNHPKVEIRLKGPHYARQCIRCGSIVGQWISHDKVLKKDTIKPFDENLRDNYLATVRELRAALLECQRDTQKQDFNTWYQEYLKSNEWSDKRSRVLSRCGYICEGCGKNRASIVHHLSYVNVGHDFLFELVGLCQDCHSTLHNKEGENVK